MDRKKLITSAEAGLAIGLAAALISHRSQGFVETLSNMFFFGGIALLVAALGALTVFLGFYDAARYGFKRLAVSRGENDEDKKKRKEELGDYKMFVQNNQRGSVKKELFVSAFILLTCSVLLALPRM